MKSDSQIEITENLLSLLKLHPVSHKLVETECILDYYYFSVLFPEDPKSFDEWDELFERSTAVHFASSQTFSFVNVGNQNDRTF